MTLTKARVMDAEIEKQLRPPDTTNGGTADPTQTVAETGSSVAPTLDVANQKTSAEYYPLDPRFVAFSKLVGLISLGVVAVIGLIVLGVFWFASGFTWIWWTAAGSFVVILMLLLWLSFAWPKIEHRHYLWRLDETGLEIVRGVYWRHRISVPIARLQHADISQGPIQRQFGLAKLTVHTAGTSNASVEVDGLAYETATWLRDQLIRQREELDVV